MRWRATTPASDGTHHVIDGRPLYAQRFDEVLSFHEPGLAPVRRGTSAWHILPDGTAGYRRRFSRVFGFYGGLAAVVPKTGEGWHHVLPDGSDAYASRFAWCGNFQEGRCAVRETGGAYLHIVPDGTPAYGRWWSYVGDFRGGVGVVQDASGRSTHIDSHGKLLHSLWFLDLDVFHKGCARARDTDGWTHVAWDGQSLYSRRFASVEPFYNGQVRVERFDGGLEVIDEMGSTLCELRQALRSPFSALSGDMVGFWRTQTIGAAAELAMFDALPGTTASVAATCRLRRERTGRLLRALDELGLVRRTRETWRTTPRGRFLETGHPWTLAGAAREYRRNFSRMWEGLAEALRADADWRPPNVFGEVATDTTRTAAHHEMLASYARHDYRSVAPALGSRGNERVLDAGGGLGVLAQMLVRAHPEVHVTVLDRPEVVDRGRQRTRDERISFEPVDIFAPWDKQGDVVILARVLHDWDDQHAVEILRQARRSLPSGGRLFAIEMVMDEDAMAGGLCDLHLLMATGGKERTLSEYGVLLREVGFDVTGPTHLPALPSVIEGVAR